jgi:hypothetical protein
MGDRFFWRASRRRYDVRAGSSAEEANPDTTTTAMTVDILSGLPTFVLSNIPKQ